MNLNPVPNNKKVLSPEDFDTETFILEVKKQECIWNVQSKSYNLKCVRNREVKRKAWDEIGSVFISDWEQLSIEERQKKVETMSRKWANIRKYYTDEVRKAASLNPPRKRRRQYHHLLTFLDETVLKKRVPRIKEFKNIVKEKGENNSSDSESGELLIIEDVDELEQLKKRHAKKPTTPPELNRKDNLNTYLSDNCKSRITVDLWNNPVAPAVIRSSATEMVKKNPEIIKLLNETRDPPPINNNFSVMPQVRPIYSNVFQPPPQDYTAEASKRFLLSLLPEIMSFNVRQNLQFRLGIIGLLNDIKLKVNPNVNTNLFPNNCFQ